MSNPNIAAIKTSTNTLFEDASSNPSFEDVFAKRSADGTTLEGVFVPYPIAIRGFPEMQDFNRPYLGLRRIKDSGLIVVRHVIELVLEEPIVPIVDGRVRSESAQQFIVDGERLFCKLRRERELEKETRDISRPLEPSKELKLAGGGEIERLAKKMLVVAGAAATSNTVLVTKVAESA